MKIQELDPSISEEQLIRRTRLFYILWRRLIGGDDFSSQKFGDNLSSMAFYDGGYSERTGLFTASRWPAIVKGLLANSIDPRCVLHAAKSYPRIRVEAQFVFSFKQISLEAVLSKCSLFQKLLVGSFGKVNKYIEKKLAQAKDLPFGDANLDWFGKYPTGLDPCFWYALARVFSRHDLAQTVEKDAVKAYFRLSPVYRDVIAAIDKTSDEHLYKESERLILRIINP